MPTFHVSGKFVVEMTTEVEADSKEQAVEIARTRGTDTTDVARSWVVTDAFNPPLVSGLNAVEMMPLFKKTEPLVFLDEYPSLTGDRSSL